MGPVAPTAQALPAEVAATPFSWPPATEPAVVATAVVPARRARRPRGGARRAAARGDAGDQGEQPGSGRDPCGPANSHSVPFASAACGGACLPALFPRGRKPV